ncbi:tetratricopeptide repeat protein [Tautonia sociabilis]|uniref:tetratricopeptide repeat protein n=1 Tax=Tautonia sociabilis TaxID=2080755 RepID=UPI001315A8E0|nr:tetratricopeptide repeat protein [Tautonia sociabilis]
MFGLISALLVALLGGGLSLVRQHSLREAHRRDEAAIRRGRALLELGRPDRALDVVGPIDESSPLLAEALTVRGMALAALDRVEESRQTLERSLRVGPVQPMAAKVLAAIYFSRSETDRGLKLLRLASQIDPADFRPWFATGKVLMILDRPAEAADAYARALELHPGDRDSRIGLIRALVASGDADTATPHLEAALRQGPNDPEALALAALLALARGEPEHALDYADRCLAIDPSRSDALLTRARIHRAFGRADLALADAEDAVRLAPNDPAALNFLALAEAAAGFSERSQATSARHRDLVARIARMHELTDQIQANPDDPEPRWRLGLEALEAGEIELARQSFQAALALQPDCPPALQGLAALSHPIPALPSSPDSP